MNVTDDETERFERASEDLRLQIAHARAALHDRQKQRKEARREYAREYYAKHREEYLEYQRQYRAEQREKDPEAYREGKRERNQRWREAYALKSAGLKGRQPVAVLRGRRRSSAMLAPS